MQASPPHVRSSPLAENKLRIESPPSCRNEARGGKSFQDLVITPVKGFSTMHDTVPTQALDHPSSPVSQQLVAFLQALLQPPRAEQAAALPTPRRGRPARLS